MRAIRPKEPGGPEVLVLEDIPTPAPASGEALVRIEAAGVNFIDIYQRSGQYPMPLPMPLGLEGAGVVEAVAADVADLSGDIWGSGSPDGALRPKPRPGDRVAWAAGRGSYATHVAIPAARLVPVPDGLDCKVAAAAMLQGMTAHYLACTTYPLRPGDICLVHAAAGGVGLLLCQLAKRAGARVFGTVSTEEKAERARAAGADEVILYTQTNFESEVHRLTGGAGVSVVYDSVGKDTFDRSLSSLRRRGMLVLYGQSSGPVPPFDPQRLARGGSLFLTRPSLGDYIATREDLMARAGDVLGSIASGALNIAIGAEFPLAAAADAHRALAGRTTTGKVLLLPPS